MSDDLRLPRGLTVHTKTTQFDGGVDMTQCRASVSGGDRWGFHQCTRKGTVDERGMLWCRQHAPSTVAAKNAAQAAKEKAEREKRNARYERDHTRTAVADTALRYFRQQATHDELEAAVNAYAAALDAVAAAQKG